MEYLNQRLLKQEWDVYVPGRCTMTGCEDRANGLCEEHNLLVDAIIDDLIDLDLTETKIMQILEQLRDRMSRKNALYFYKKDGKSDFFNARSIYDIILYLIDKDEIDISIFTTHDGLRKCLKKENVYSIPSGDLDLIVITFLQRKVKELYSQNIISHVY